MIRWLQGIKLIGRRRSNDPALRLAFRRAEQEGLALAIRARSAALGVIILWLVIQFPRLEVAWTVALCIAFLVSGAVQWRMLRAEPRRLWMLFALLSLDVLIVALATLLPNPLLETAPPYPLMLKLGSVVFFFILIAMTGLFTSPVVTVWTGLCAAGIWLAATEWIARTEGAFRMRDLPNPPAFNSPEALMVYTDLFYVDDVQSRQNAIVLLVVAGIVAALVQRARGLVAREARSASDRAALARYFSPGVVDEITRDRGTLDEAKATDAAVIFIDVRGFSGIAETLSPQDTIALLRRLHGLIADAVFAETGTLDKFTGDGAMALFGVPRPRGDDAWAAVNAIRRLLAAMDSWNAERRQAGQVEIHLGIGAHYGPVVSGNAGGDQQLDFTAIGDAVNVASRLERLTRELDSDVIVSEALWQRAADLGGAEALAEFRSHPPQTVRGRLKPVAIRLMVSEPNPSYGATEALSSSTSQS